jgi:hypothetical protein
MALPNNEPSAIPILGNFIPPYNWIVGPWNDFEEGGIAFQDGTLGTQVQMWECVYNGDKESPTYGDITIIPLEFGDATTIINVPDVEEIAFAFNQNMDVIIAYYTKAKELKYYYYDTLGETYQTNTLPAGSRSPQLCLDDHRWLETGSSDDILAYIRNGTLYYRQERERYTVERSLGSGVGDARLRRVGMQDNFRLKFDVRVGSGNRLCDIVGDLCLEAGIDGNDLELLELCPITVRGYMASSVFSAAEAIRGLQRVYFFDMPEIDFKIHGLLKGRDIEATVPYDDFVLGSEANVETGREQELEYAWKVHLAFACAETDYTPTKETSERLSDAVNVRTEIQVECFVNFESAEAVQRADILHKVSWSELEGRITGTLPRSYSWVAPSNVLRIETRPGVYKRVRIEETNTAAGEILVKGLIDRKSAWSSGAIAPSFELPTPPPSSLPGETTWAYLDIPAVAIAADFLHYAVAGYGLTSAWTGGQLQRQIETEYVKEAELTNKSTLGILDEALPFAPRKYTDTTNTILVTTNKDLESISEVRLLSGGNAMAIVSAGGIEILQFRDAVAEGAAWRLSYLLRGRLDTTPAAHIIGDSLVMLKQPTFVPADATLMVEDFNLRLASYGTVPSDATPRSVSFTGESQREWAPVYLVSSQNGNDWNFAWTPRLRLGTPATPIASVYHYAWRLRFTVGATVVFHDTQDRATTNYLYTEAQQIAEFGSAQGSFDSVDIMGLNQFTGEGRALSEAV